MKIYLDAMQHILDNGIDAPDRTGTGTKNIFGLQMRFDLSKEFPAMTTKKLAWKSVVSELLWFIEGSSDERRLAEILHGTRDPSKKTIWTANAEAEYWKPKAKFDGDLGRIYGVQWRSWQKPNGDTIDQLAELIDGLKRDPYGRRHLLTAWNPGEIDDMALPPCHTLSQFYVLDNKLYSGLYQRSADFFLGVPFNIASYALFTHMIAQICGYEVGEYVHTIGVAHIYNNHIEQVKEQLSRTPFPLAQLELNKEITSIDGFKMSDINLSSDYKSHDAIKAPMAV